MLRYTGCGHVRNSRTAGWEWMGRHSAHCFGRSVSANHTLSTWPPVYRARPERRTCSTSSGPPLLCPRVPDRRPA
eukprot:4932940-Prymnesium_polylepis.1